MLRGGIVGWWAYDDRDWPGAVRRSKLIAAVTEELIFMSPRVEQESENDGHRGGKKMGLGYRSIILVCDEISAIWVGECRDSQFIAYFPNVKPPCAYAHPCPPHVPYQSPS